MRETIVAAPAKVNLFLRVLARETSGYHQIESLFQGLALHDRVRIRLRDAPGVELRVEGEEDLGPPGQNLAVRAARAYRACAGLDGAPGVVLRLEKRIPVGAGLGGGSSDAAAVLRGLDRMHGRAVGSGKLPELAAGLGSDVPFFLGAGTLALGWGRGGRLLSLPSLPERPVVVVVPPFRVSTAAAYEGLERRSRGRERRSTAPPRILQLDDLTSWDGVAARAENDFESGLFESRPMARRLRDVLVESGAAPALLSGSGSAVFGVFVRDGDADTAAGRIRDSFDGVTIHRTRTLEGWPEPEVEA